MKKVSMIKVFFVQDNEIKLTKSIYGNPYAKVPKQLLQLDNFSINPEEVIPDVFPSENAEYVIDLDLVKTTKFNNIEWKGDTMIKANKLKEKTKELLPIAKTKKKEISIVTAALALIGAAALIKSIVTRNKGGE